MLCDRDFLLSFSSFSLRPSRKIRRKIFYFNLIKNYNHYNPSVIPNGKFYHNTLTNKCNNKIKISKKSVNNFNLANDSINFSLINIRSINKKSSIIYDLLTSNQLDLFCITETWHESSDSPALLSSIPSNYSFFDVPRPALFPLSHKHSSYGGVCLIYNKKFSSSFDNTLKFESFECLFSHFKSFSYNFIIVVIYRPPKSSLSNFIDDFYKLSEHLFSLSLPFFILGDFNLHFNDPNNFYVSKFLDIINLFNLKQHISVSTHSSGNIIDYIITPSSTKLNNLLINPITYSDHHLISFTYNLSTPFINTTIKFYRRNWKQFNVEQFVNLFKFSNLFEFDHFGDVNDFLLYLTNSVSNILDMIIPFKLFSFRLLSKRAPWFDSECISLKRLARKFERIYRSKLNSSSFLQYKTSLNNYKSCLFSKHCNFLRHSIIKASSSKNRWFALSKLLYKNLPPPSSFSAQDYHDYILNKVNLIRSNISLNSSNLNTSNANNNDNNRPLLEFFSPISLSELSSIINTMSSSSCFLDLIPTTFIKNMSDIFYPLILKIVNLSLSTSNFPQSFKSSIIIPTLKNNSLDPSLLSSYRPIANLSFISKIIEKVVYKQLYHFLNTNSLLPSTQSGFRLSHSCETSLLKLYNDLIFAFDHNESSVLVCLDYSSAFDTVDHNLLLHVLENNFYIKNSCLSWFKSYLSNRSAYVSLNHSNSKPISLDFGVPQGSILGPLLFILYVSELSNIISSHNFSSLSYADDSHLYSSFKFSSYDSIMSSISSCLASIECWSSSMSLKLNPSKFELIYFNRNGNLIQKPCVFSTNTIEPSNYIRSLGFILDSKLTLSNQILSVTKNCYFHLRRIKQLLAYLDDPTLQLLVSAFVLSRIDYCNSLYFNLPDTTLKPLIKVFNYAARLVSRAPLYSHVTPLLHCLHWLPIKYRIIFKICTIMFKLKDNFAPVYLKCLVNRPHKPNLRSSTTNHYFIPSINHIFAKRSFSYAGPFLWNNLPSDLTKCNSLYTFRRGLKTFLFNQFLGDI